MQPSRSKENRSSLNDFFRGLAEWKLPKASSASLERIPLASAEKDKEKFALVDLAEFRGQSVDSVIARSVEKYLERSNYNNVGELIELLKKTGIEFAIREELKDRLAAMMSRRHWIAHRVDRVLLEEIDLRTMQRGLSILPEIVVEWKSAVIEVGESVLKALLSSEIHEARSSHGYQREGRASSQKFGRHRSRSPNPRRIRLSCRRISHFGFVRDDGRW